MKAIVDCGNGGTPHQKNNTKVVELVSESRYLAAVVVDDVERRRQEEADSHSQIESIKDDNFHMVRTGELSEDSNVGPDSKAKK